MERRRRVLTMQRSTEVARYVNEPIIGRETERAQPKAPITP
jgi:hypothetical protein